MDSTEFGEEESLVQRRESRYRIVMSLVAIAVLVLLGYATQQSIEGSQGIGMPTYEVLALPAKDGGQIVQLSDGTVIHRTPDHRSRPATMEERNRISAAAGYRKFAP